MSEPVLRYPGPCRVARLLRREKRFFVFVELDGREVAAHTNNTGTMLGLLRPGSPVLRSPASNPARKLSWTVEALEKLGFQVLPSQSNFLFARTDRVDGGELYRMLKERGILVRHFANPRICQFNRITIGTPEQMETFLAVTKEILGL